MILSPCAAEVLDGQSGYQRDGVAVQRNRPTTGANANPNGIYSDHVRPAQDDQGYGAGGGASRFFLNAGYELWELEWILANGLRPCGGGL